jgi:hypothetical protein
MVCLNWISFFIGVFGGFAICYFLLGLFVLRPYLKKQRRIANFVDTLIAYIGNDVIEERAIDNFVDNLITFIGEDTIEGNLKEKGDEQNGENEKR